MKHKILFSFLFVLVSLVPGWSQLTTMHATLSGIGIKSMNGLTAKTQTFATGTTGTDFNISSSGTIHTFNIPTASATNRGLLSSADWITFNSHFTLPAFTAGSVIFSNGTTLAQDNPNFFWDDTNNRLAIGGTTNPATELQVISTSNSDPRGIMSSQFSSDTLGARVHLRKSRGTVASPSSIVSGDILGRIRFSGFDGSNYLQMANIDVVSSGTVATNRIPTYMAFSTASNTLPSVLTERMRITSEGNIGITITNPSSKVSIGNDGGYNGNLFVASGARIANLGGVEFVNNGSVSYTGQGISLAGNNRMIEFLGSNNNTVDDFIFRYRTGNGIFSNPTSGTKTFLEIAGGSTSFTPTSGTASYNTLSLVGTINQTGGANGVTRGLYINPTINSAADYRAIEVAAGSINVTKTITTPGTTGNQTINKLAGTVNIAAAGTTVTVTNSLVTANSIIMCTVQTNDTTAVLKNVVPAAGSFVITLNAATTAETAIAFFVIN